MNSTVGKLRSLAVAPAAAGVAVVLAAAGVAVVLAAEGPSPGISQVISLNQSMLDNPRPVG